MLLFSLQSQQLSTDTDGRVYWQNRLVQKNVLAEQAAVIVCDMWDNHWSRGAAQRVEFMVGRMNIMLHTARDQGVSIIHAPSEVMDFYHGHPARLRIANLEPVALPDDLEHDDPPLPIDDSDGGSDTGETGWYKAWTRQHAAIDVDPDRDVISDMGSEVYAWLKHRQIEQVAIMGVHTNMCVLRRSFAIKQMVRWGVSIALVRDLTDAMYNPAMRPYVSHEAGTQLVIEYIEKFWCPSISSTDLAGA